MVRPGLGEPAFRGEAIDSSKIFCVVMYLSFRIQYLVPNYIEDSFIMWNIIIHHIFACSRVREKVGAMDSEFSSCLEFVLSHHH